VLGQTDNTTSARAAVGVSEDGNEVYLLVVDGGDFFYSNGIGCNDLALLMKGCGAYNALALNAGNTVTAVWRNMRSENLFDLLNKPANKGVEAPVAGGILIVQ
jgi:exopolysaccharide biosynthesis protein